MSKILIVDDEKSIRNALREILEYENYSIDEAQDGLEGISKLKETSYDLVLCDIKMPKADGLDVLNYIVDHDIDVQIIMISAHGTIETAVEAVKKGAYDFISKPPDLNRLLITVKNALDKKELITESKVLKKKYSKKNEIIGETPEILELKQNIERVGQTDARVLILGPNGSGKELVAKGLHQNSPRSKKQMIEVNCAAIPADLIESELFGHEKGAFTSAIKQRIGKFEQASGGTIFLDEIGDMSLTAQAKVLRALQEQKITRVGSDKEIKVDVRVIAATNKDLKQEIKNQMFREDLYHRLSVIVLKVPQLNDRKADIPLLINKFLDDIAKEYGATKKNIEKKAIDQLMKKDWSGNIRELRNCIERLVILSGSNITIEDVKKYAD